MNNNKVKARVIFKENVKLDEVVQYLEAEEKRNAVQEKDESCNGVKQQKLQSGSDEELEIMTSVEMFIWRPEML